MEIYSMRHSALCYPTFAFAALMLANPLAAEDAVTRVAPVPLVPFRSGAAGRDMTLREPAPAAPRTATTSIVRAPFQKRAPAPATAGVTRPPATVSPAEPRARQPLPTALTKTTPQVPAAPRSALPARSEPPLSALPPGGRDLALQPTSFTPYDRYLGSVRSVISNLEVRESSMLVAARMMKEGRRFRYCVCDPYRADPPALTEARRAGDCKSKALWLYDNLGDGNALFVIGKAEKRARTSHAWVYWRWDERWWILDCTERSDPVAADSVSSDRYVPYYSFGKGGSYRHKATRLILTGALHPSAKPVSSLR
jgi:hypothetical protein